MTRVYKTRTTRPPLMTHEERRKLIDTPITITTLGHTHGWAGQCISEKPIHVMVRRTRQELISQFFILNR